MRIGSLTHWLIFKLAFITSRQRISISVGVWEAQLPQRKKRWVAKVKTDSTQPAPGLFKKDSATIAGALASKKVSPKGPGSGMRMLTYFINRAGKGLTPTRRRELERAKKLLSKRVREARQKKAA